MKACLKVLQMLDYIIQGGIMFIKKSKRSVALLLILVMIIGIMPAMTFGLDTAEVERASLFESINNAENLRVNTTEFSSDTEAIASLYVEPTYAVTASPASILKQTIKDALTVYSDPNKTAEAYASTKSNIDSAITIFNSERFLMIPTASLSACVTQLTTVIDTAIISVDGTEVSPTNRWITKEFYDSLVNSKIRAQSAIDAAIPRDVERLYAYNDAKILLSSIERHSQYGNSTPAHWVATYPKIDSISTTGDLYLLMKSDQNANAKIKFNLASEPALSRSIVVTSGASISISANVETGYQTMGLKYNTAYRANIVLGNSDAVTEVLFTTIPLPSDVVTVGSSSYSDTNFNQNTLATQYSAKLFKLGKVYVWDKPKNSTDPVPSPEEMAQKRTIYIEENGNFKVGWNHSTQPNGEYDVYFMFEDLNGNKTQVLYIHSYSYVRQSNIFQIEPQHISNDYELNSLSIQFALAEPGTVQMKIITDSQYNASTRRDDLLNFSAEDEIVVNDTNIYTKTFDSLQLNTPYWVISQIKGLPETSRFERFCTKSLPKLDYTLSVSKPSFADKNTDYTFHVTVVGLYSGQKLNAGHDFTIPAGSLSGSFKITDEIPSIDRDYTFVLTDAAGNNFRPSSDTASGLSLSSQGEYHPSWKPILYVVSIPKVIDMSVGLKLSPSLEGVTFNYFALEAKTKDSNVTIGKIDYNDGTSLNTSSETVLNFKAIEQVDPIYVTLSFNSNAFAKPVTAFLTDSTSDSSSQLVVGTGENKKYLDNIQALNNMHFTLVDNDYKTKDDNDNKTKDDNKTENALESINVKVESNVISNEITVSYVPKNKSAFYYYLSDGDAVPSKEDVILKGHPSTDDETNLSKDLKFYGIRNGTHRINFVLKDSYGALSQVFSKAFTVGSGAYPISFINDTPKVTSYAKSQMYVFQLNHYSKVYYLYKIASAPAPSKAEVLAMSTPATTGADNVAIANVSSPSVTAGNYTLYAVGVDNSGDSTDLVSVNFNVPIAPPAFPAGGGGGGGSAIAPPVTPPANTSTIKPVVPVVDVKPVLVGNVLTATIPTTQLESTKAVSVSAVGTTYTLPTSQVSTEAIAQASNISAGNIKSVEVAVLVTPAPATFTTLLKTAKVQLISPVVEFNVVANVTLNDGSKKRIEMDKFTEYVTREFEVTPIPGKAIVGVLFNEDGSYRQVPTTVIQKDGKTYARLNSLSNSTYGVIAKECNANSAPAAWNKDVVNVFISKEIIDAKMFETNKNITRIEFITMLVKALGVNIDNSTKSSFVDVKENASYVEVAKQLGLVTGSGNKFFPDSTITREEMAVIMMRANKVLKMTKGTSAVKTFTDASKVSKWANDMLILSEYGVFNGYADGTLRPQGKLTQSEAIQIIYNALKNSKLMD